MPGLTTVETLPDRDILDEALESVRFTPAYERHTAVDEQERLIAHTGYDAYPVSVFDADGATVVLEGYLYDADDTESIVTALVPLLREGDGEAISDWVTERDGDFLIVVADHTGGTTWVVNDLFGRLPTYRATIDGATVLTRELKVVRELANSLEDGLEPDQLGVGQTLLFGYPLGTRTLYEGVSQLPPGSVFELGTDEPQSLHEWHLDHHTNAGASLRRNAKRLKDRFVESCRNRADVRDETVVSLSGGLDSRAVIAGYTYTDGAVTAATSMREDGANATEVDVARQVAHTLDVPWTSYVADQSERHRAELLDMTQGMNNLGMSIGLDFAEQVAANHENPMFVTGDGIAIPDRKPRMNVDSMDDLVDAIVTEKHVFPLDDVVSLVDVTANELRTSLRDRLEAYPETTIDGKHLHFFFRERAINFQNHGEDRTRYHLWSTTPAYSPAFFKESMACPPEQKRGSRLVRAFLTELNSDVVDIDYVDYGVPINTVEYRAKRFVYEWLLGHPELKTRVKKLLNGSHGGSGIDAPRELVYAPNGVTATDSPLSTQAVQRITWNQDSYSAHQKNLLLTVVSALSQDLEDRPVTGART